MFRGRLSRSFSTFWRAAAAAVQATPFAVRAATGALTVSSLSSATASTSAQVEAPQQQAVQRSDAAGPILDVEPKPLDMPNTKHGLLGPTSNDLFYAQTIANLNDAAADWRSADVLGSAARGDKEDFAAYVAGVNKAAQAFIAKKELWNREATKGKLLSYAMQKGSMVIFLGGKNTGKSLLIKNIAAALNSGDTHTALIVNMRDGETKLGPAIIKQLTKWGAATPSSRAFDVAMSLKSTAKSFVALLEQLPNKSVSLGAKAAGAAIDAYSPLAPTPPVAADVLEAFVVACEQNGRSPVLIIDESNRAFTSEDADETKAILSKLTKLTKEDGRLTVIFGSSEHAEPYRLERLGFNSHDLADFVIAGEVPPADMRALLTTQWGCGPRLADALLNLYGGHIRNASRAVAGLAMHGAKYPAHAALGPPVGVDACFESLKTGTAVVGDVGSLPINVDRARLEAALRALAVDGFFPLKERLDPVAELLSFNNVAGVVALTATFEGVPGVLQPSVWDAHPDVEWALIPSNQSTRLQLAKYLVDMEAERRSDEEARRAEAEARNRWFPFRLW